MVRLPQGSAWIDARYSFETEYSSCSAIVQLVLDEEGEWRVWVLRTVLEGLKSVPSVDELEPVSEEVRSSNGAGKGKGDDEESFEAVVIGGGLAGLSTAGRLKALGVKYVLVDKNENVGDNWKLRYGSARCESGSTFL